MSIRDHLSEQELKFWNVPEICPKCSSELTIEDHYVCCVNSECPTHIVSDIYKFITKLDIKFIGEKSIKTLVDSGVIKTPEDLVNLSQEDYTSFERQGAKNYKKLMSSIREKTTNVPLSRFLAAFNIQHMAEGIATRIVDAGYDTLDKIFNMTETQIAECELVGATRAPGILADLHQRREVIEAVLSSGVTLKQKVEGGKLAGKSFCQTGSFPGMTRKQLIERIEAEGGTWKASVVKGLDFLICEDPEGSSGKLQKARKNGVELVTPDDFMSMLN